MLAVKERIGKEEATSRKSKKLIVYGEGKKPGKPKMNNYTTNS